METMQITIPSNTKKIGDRVEIIRTLRTHYSHHGKQGIICSMTCDVFIDFDTNEPLTPSEIIEDVTWRYSVQFDNGVYDTFYEGDFCIGE